MGGSSEQPVPATQNTTTKGKSTSKVDMKTGSTTRPVMPSWLEDQLKTNVGAYGDATVDFGNMVDNWHAAGFSPDQLAAFDAARGAVGGQDMQTALDAIRRTAEGDYLYGGAGFNAAVDAAYRAGMPSVLSAFGAGGRSDGGLAKVALARAFSDPFAMQYGQERSRQLNAAQLLPGMALMPSQVLENIGKQYQELEQYGINTPFQLQGQYLNAISGLTPLAAPFMGSDTKGFQKGKTVTNSVENTTGTSTPSYFPGSQGAGVLGGALSGAGMGAQLGSVIPGIGTGIGAGVGALIGGGSAFF